MDYLQLIGDDVLPQIKTPRPFKCVVIVDLSVSQEWQEKVSMWLVNSGCLYMMAWGKDCSSWDDSVDYANIEQFENQEIPPRSFVMNTWNEGESLYEVFKFCKYFAIHEVKNLKDTLLLHISKTDMSETITRAYESA